MSIVYQKYFKYEVFINIGVLAEAHGIELTTNQRNTKRVQIQKLDGQNPPS